MDIEQQSAPQARALTDRSVFFIGLLFIALILLFIQILTTGQRLVHFV